MPKVNDYVPHWFICLAIFAVLGGLNCLMVFQHKAAVVVASQVPCTVIDMYTSDHRINLKMQCSTPALGKVTDSIDGSSDVLALLKVKPFDDIWNATCDVFENKGIDNCKPPGR